jgi:hypothetical protein
VRLPPIPIRQSIPQFEFSPQLWFYKKGCQEKKLLRELEAAKSLGIQPPAAVQVPRGV